MNSKDLKRFMGKVMFEPNTGCWLWNGPWNHAGYGSFKLHNSNVRSHKISFIHFKGLVRPGLSVAHKCHTRCCVNPDHLESISHKQNCIDRNKRKIYCNKGHLFTDENKKPQNKGKSYCCRICANEANRLYRLQRKADRSSRA